MHVWMYQFTRIPRTTWNVSFFVTKIAQRLSLASLVILGILKTKHLGDASLLIKMSDSVSSFCFPSVSFCFLLFSFCFLLCFLLFSSVFLFFPSVFFCFLLFSSLFYSVYLFPSCCHKTTTTMHGASLGDENTRLKICFNRLTLVHIGIASMQTCTLLCRKIISNNKLQFYSIIMYRIFASALISASATLQREKKLDILLYKI